MEMTPDAEAPPSSPPPPRTAATRRAETAEPPSRRAGSSLRFAAVALALCILPIAVAGAAHFLMRSVHRPVETVLVGADAKPEFVTALAWSPITGNVLWVGTEAGRVVKLAADGAVEAITPSAGGPVLRIQPVSDSEHFDLVERAASLNASSFGAQAFFVRQVAEGADPESPGVVTERGLFAVADDTARTRLVGVVSTTVPLNGFQTKEAQSSGITTALELAVARTDSDPPEPIGTGSPRVLVPILGSGAVAAGFDDGSVAEIVRVQGVEGQLQSQQAQPVQPAAQRVAALEIGRIAASSQSGTGAAVEPAITALAVATPSDGSTVILAAIADGTIGAWRRPRAGARWNTEPLVAAYEPSQVWTEVGKPTSTDVSPALEMSGDLQQIVGFDVAQRLVVQTLDGSMPDWGPETSDPTSGRLTSMQGAGVLRVIFSTDIAMFWTSTGVDVFGRDGSYRKSFGNGSSPIIQAALSNDGRWVAAARADGTLSIYDTDSGKAVVSSLNVGGAVFSLALDSRTATPVAAGMADGSLVVFGRGSQTPVSIAVSPGRRILKLGFTSDGRRIATLDDNGDIRTLSSRSLRLLSNFRTGNGAAQFLTGNDLLSGDGNFAADFVAAKDGIAIRISDLVSGREVGRVASGIVGLSNPKLNYDGTRIAVAESGTIRIWARTPGDEVETAMPRVAENGLKLSADGSALLLREPSGALHFARLTGTETHRLRAVSMPVPAIDAVLNADGSQIIAACADATIRIVPTDDLSGASAILLSGHGGLVHRMALSPDGRHLASASIDGRLRITDLVQLARVARLPLFDLPTGPDLAPIRPQRLEGSPPTARPASARKPATTNPATRTLDAEELTAPSPEPGPAPRRSGTRSLGLSLSPSWAQTSWPLPFWPRTGFPPSRSPSS